MLCPFFMSRMSQRSIRTGMPIATTVKIPLTLEDHAQAMKVPVPSSHPHHSGENSLDVSMGY